jgi:hypothetical protein
MSKKINYTSFVPDSIVDTILNKFVDRAEMGFTKYNNTLDRNDLNLVQWINHAQEEAMDLVLYLEKIKQEVINGQKDTGNSQTDTTA